MNFGMYWNGEGGATIQVIWWRLHRSWRRGRNSRNWKAAEKIIKSKGNWQQNSWSRLKRSCTIWRYLESCHFYANALMSSSGLCRVVVVPRPSARPKTEKRIWRRTSPPLPREKLATWRRKALACEMSSDRWPRGRTRLRSIRCQAFPWKYQTAGAAAWALHQPFVCVVRVTSSRPKRSCSAFALKWTGTSGPRMLFWRSRHEKRTTWWPSSSIRSRMNGGSRSREELAFEGQRKAQSNVFVHLRRASLWPSREQRWRPTRSAKPLTCKWLNIYLYR